MTLPSARFPRLDAMAVSASHNALVACNFGFHCGNRLISARGSTNPCKPDIFEATYEPAAVTS